MKHSLLWPAILAGVSPILAAQDEVVRPGSLCPQGSAEVVGATEAAANLLPRLVTPIHTAADDPDGGAYGTWAAGQDYKVSFHGAPTFVPYLGADYPHNQPLTWHLESVTAGGDELLSGDAATRSYSTDRYEYRYGSVTEAYDVRLEGLEQSFVIAQRPTSAGDLVVSMRVDAQMEATGSFVDQHRAVVFADQNGSELVRYGEAFIVDAAGSKQPIGTTILGNTIRLTVPASMVADAKFPLTVDPLTTPIAIRAGVDIATSDVVRNDRSNSVCTTYSRNVSATDADCWGWSSADGLPTLGTLVFTDITAAWSTSQTSCACIGTAAVNRFIIAVSREFIISSGIRIWNQDATTPVLSTSVTGPGTGGSHNWNVDCGGIEAYNQSGNGPAGVEGIVVYQKDTGGSIKNTPNSDIYALIVTGSGTGITFGTEIPVRAFAGRDCDYPSVNKVSEGSIGGAPTDWFVAFQEYNNSIAGDDWDAIAIRVLADETVTANLWVPSDSSGAHKIDLQIEGQRGRYLVTYGRVDEAGGLTKITGRLSNQIVNERFDFPVGGVRTRYPAEPTSGNLGRIFRVFDVGYDADGDSIWAPIWSAPGGSGSVFYERVGYTGDRLEVSSITPATGVALSRAGICYNDDANNFISNYGQDDGRLFSVEVTMADEISPPIVAGVSCSVASIGWELQDSLGVTVSNANADQQIGTEFGTVVVSGMPGSAVSVLGLSLRSSNINIGGIPGVGFRCRDLIAAQTSAFLGFFDIRIGASGEWQLPLPEFVSPMTLNFQAFHLNAAGDQFLSTQRLEVPIY